MMEEGFVKAQSDNLPSVDAIMVANYFANNECFNIAESSGVKSDKAGRQSYGDAAIGWVQLRRNGHCCIVKCKITPEHKIKNKQYIVTIVVNEDADKVVSITCEGCVAAAGGCKHGIALLMWVHRRSEEPSPTDRICYWARSKMSRIGNEIGFVKATDFGATTHLSSDEESESFLKELIEVGIKKNADVPLLKYFHSDIVADIKEHLSVYHLMLQFISTGKTNPVEFLLFCKQLICQNMCQKAAESTCEQAGSSLWFDLRFARITASKLYDAAHCKTDGSLVETLLGTSKVKDTVAKQRGRNLEGPILKILEGKLGMHFTRIGLMVSKEHPIIGASPDAICEEYTIEIKCPFHKKTINSYITKDGKITAKYNAQVQLQMYCFNKKKALYCVADPNFESNNDVQYIFVNYDKTFTEDIMNKAEQFWIKYIFEKLYNSLK